MALFKPDTPQPPNPNVVAGAQTASNVDTAIANAYINNMNQVDQYGNTLAYAKTGEHDWTDTTTGRTYRVPRFTATQSLAPNQRAIANAYESAQGNLANLARDQSARVGRVLGEELNFNTLPRGGDLSWIANTPAALTSFGPTGSVAGGFAPTGSVASGFAGTGNAALGFAGVGGPQRAFGQAGSVGSVIGNAGPIGSTFGTAGNVMGTLSPTQQAALGFAGVGGPQRTFGAAGNMTRTYGPSDSFSADRGRVEQALYGRLNPQLQEERRNIEQRLADQGIRYGSPAFTAAMDDYNRQANDARLAVTQTAGQEQQRMMDMAAQRAGFENAAQQQAYQQAQGRGAFANQAQQQAYEQAFGRGQFANQALQQRFQELQARGAFANAAQQQRFAQAQARGQFANAAEAQRFAEMTRRAEFGNQAQQQRFAQAQARGTFTNAAQQQAFAQAQARGSFLNQAQQQRYEQALGRGQFLNQAQQQRYEQALGRGSFANAAQNQRFTQAQARAGFYNLGAAQRQQQQTTRFNAAQTARNQALQEAMALRNQPINEISALMTGSQVSSPNWLNTPSSQIANTDVAGIMQAGFQNQFANFQAQNQNWQQLMGGVLGLGGNVARGALSGSDRRMKRDVRRMGTTFAAGDDGARHRLPIYEYSYKDDVSRRRHVGPMAQDVERIDKGAVVKDRKGMRYLKTGRVMGDIFAAA